ncbi:MAG: endonuclease III [Alphaproteobacteria bacterium]|nr:endonuclease III [Alphaproteobacteria bacterium]
MLSAPNVDRLFARFAERFPERNRRPGKVDADPFRSLVSVMLSAQTTDTMSARASAKLFAVADTPNAVLALQPAHLRALIRDAGLYNNKARSIQAMCRDLQLRFAGEVPSTRRELMSLPGVGRKSADIMLRFVFGEPAVAVDTHVHRVCNRTGLARGKTEAQTAVSLEPRVPDGYRFGAHMWLLEHGKRICKARKPACGQCLLADMCERNGVA